MCQGLLFSSVVLPYIKTGGSTAYCSGELYYLLPPIKCVTGYYVGGLYCLIPTVGCVKGYCFGELYY